MCFLGKQYNSWVIQNFWALVYVYFFHQQYRQIHLGSLVKLSRTVSLANLLGNSSSFYGSTFKPLELNVALAKRLQITPKVVCMPVLCVCLYVYLFINSRCAVSGQAELILSCLLFGQSLENRDPRGNIGTPHRQ